MRAFLQSRTGLVLIAIATIFVIHVAWPGAISKTFASFGHELSSAIGGLIESVAAPLILLGIVVYAFGRLIGIRGRGGGGQR